MTIKKVKAVGKPRSQRIYVNMDVCGGLQVILDNLEDKLAVVRSWQDVSNAIITETSKVLGQDPNARIDWALITEYFERNRMSRFIPFLNDLKRWVRTNGELMLALNLGNELFNRTIEYVNTMKERIKDMQVIAKKANCPPCMSGSPYVPEYMKVYSTAVNETNNFLLFIDEWQNRCISSGLHAEFCNNYYQNAKDISYTLKKHIDRSLYDCGTPTRIR